MVDPAGKERLYAVGDVHGCRDLLSAMLERITDDIAARPHPAPRVVMLGDYVDRGPDTRGVIDALIGFRETGPAATFLLGNHDACLLSYLRDPHWQERAFHWLHPVMGGSETLASYGIDAGGDPVAVHEAFAAALPPEHLAFLDECRLWTRSGGFVFAHAGIRPGVAMDRQDPEDLIWIRDPFLTSRADFGFKVVHGHTIVPRVEHHPNRIAVDTGAVRSGLLSCVVIEGTDVFLLGPGGPEPLPVGAGSGAGMGSGRLRAGLRGLWPRR